jgi:GNAT superfamily N-acetyltransferase/8-oxo-dGTP pyrophosphatase MutT (NUDIX family)
MTLKIRPAHPGDTSELTNILHRAKASWGYDDKAMAGFRSAFRISQSELSSCDIIVAERNGKPIGFAGGKVRSSHYFIDYLFVSPEAARQGIGHLLLTRLTDIARAAGAWLLRLESDHFAAGFYERNGFAHTGKRPSPMAPCGEIPVMEKQLPAVVHPLKDIHVRLDRSATWAFEMENRKAIDDHWQQAMAQNPLLWDGRVLKLTEYTFEDEVFTGSCRECSFSAFLAWRDWGAPDTGAFNLFGSAILRSNDGALLFGVMSDKTANPGKIYPPGGNLDPNDVLTDGSIDVDGAIYRELEEETGLSRDAVKAGDWFAVFDGPRISVARLFDVDSPADKLRDDIVRFSMASEEQELADMCIIRSCDDMAGRDVVSYARAIAIHMLAP